jgi:hypothetical protein
MFSVKFREIRGGVVGGDLWGVFEIPATVRPSVNKKDGHAFFRTGFAEPRCIPARGEIALHFMGTPVLSARYGEGGSEIPTATPWGSVAGDTITVPAPTLGPPAEAGTTPGADYAVLPVEKWVQFNSMADRFTVQARLRKVPPTPGGHLYGLDTLVVHVNQRAPPPEPAGDRERVLAI